jgi:hypothetical protein
VQAPYSQTYTFHVHVHVSDGVRLWVNGQLLIDKWKEQKNARYTGNIALLVGQKYDITVEYYDAKGAALLELSWSSASTRKQVVPPAQFPTMRSPKLITRSNAGISMVKHDPTAEFRRPGTGALLLSTIQRPDLLHRSQQPNVQPSSPSARRYHWATHVLALDDPWRSCRNPKL